ncbi:MAG: HAD hydrolase-like protein [Pseudomonadota bacterium]
MHLFFDLDGTLTDPKEGITRCMQYALEKLGAPVPTMDELLWCIGPPLHENFRRLVGDERAQAGVDFYRERFAHIGLFENAPYEGIHAVLQALTDDGHDLYLASSKALIFVERILAKYELEPFFSHVYGANLDGTLADKTELLAHALAELSVLPAVAVMIGDRHHDIIGGRNNRMHTVGVAYGYGTCSELLDAGADVVVSQPRQLPAALAGLDGAGG